LLVLAVVLRDALFGAVERTSSILPSFSVNSSHLHNHDTIDPGNHATSFELEMTHCEMSSCRTAKLNCPCQLRRSESSPLKFSERLRLLLLVQISCCLSLKSFDSIARLVYSPQSPGPWYLVTRPRPVEQFLPPSYNFRLHQQSLHKLPSSIQQHNQPHRTLSQTFRN
jgi:hypothetical protein